MDNSSLSCKEMSYIIDLHVHSHHSPCGHSGASLSGIQNEATACGLKAFGVADHVHTRSSWSRIEACRKEYNGLDNGCAVFFGIEVSAMPATHIDCLAQPPFDFSQLQCGWEDVPLNVAIIDEDISKHRVDYVLGGAHWQLGKCDDGDAVMRCFHRQNIFLLTHPKVSVLAHPWWIYTVSANGAIEKNAPWLLDFTIIPESMHNEMIAVARKFSKAIEINARALEYGVKYSERFLAQYLDFLFFLKENGVQLSIGSDSHSANYSNAIYHLLPQIESLSLVEDNIWRPKRESA